MNYTQMDGLEVPLALPATQRMSYAIRQDHQDKIRETVSIWVACNYLDGSLVSEQEDVVTAQLPGLSRFGQCQADEVAIQAGSIGAAQVLDQPRLHAGTPGQAYVVIGDLGVLNDDQVAWISAHAHLDCKSPSLPLPRS